MQRYKRVSVEGYNLVFDRQTGFFARWGKTPHDNPTHSPVGPELADIEISTICHGIGKSKDSRTPCSWCYKSNTGEGENMSFETFVKIFSKFPNTLTQIAFGIGDLDSNPDLWDIMGWTRAHGVIPNITINGMGLGVDEAEELSVLCGAVAVSHYGDDLCFNAVNKLTKVGLQQVNIHKLLSKETLSSCFKLIDQATSDDRLRGLKAVVFLMMKPKGCRNTLHPIESLSDYKALLDYARLKGVAVGMDSCSAPMALKSVPDECVESVEPCESGLFSIYVNVKGEVYPCSFSEGTPGWESGVSLLEINDFMTEVWNGPRISEWRSNLMGSANSCNCSKKADCRVCPIYDITLCKSKLVTIQ